MGSLSNGMAEAKAFGLNFMRPAPSSFTNAVTTSTNDAIKEKTMPQGGMQQPKLVNFICTYRAVAAACQHSPYPNQYKIFQVLIKM